MVDLSSNLRGPDPLVRIRCSGLVFKGDSLLLLKFDDPELGVNWELPGGGIEQSESLGSCARREVAEETGLQVETTRIAYHLLVIAPDLVTLEVVFATEGMDGDLGANTARDTHEEDALVEMRFVPRHEVLDAPLLLGPPSTNASAALQADHRDFWDRLWADRDAGLMEPVYLGTLYRTSGYFPPSGSGLVRY